MHYYTYKTFHFKLLIYNDPYTCINSIIKCLFYSLCSGFGYIYICLGLPCHSRQLPVGNTAKLTTVLAE